MIETIIQAPTVAKLCALALMVFVAVFLLQFVRKAIVRWVVLDRLNSRLKKLTESEDPTSLFAGQSDLAHLWKEFHETLFDQQKFDSVEGGYVLDKKRATVPAEQFFNPQVVVDSRVGAEFFKHLPGILTGIGIIGTFFGILHGLAAFNISDNPQLVRESLSGLLHSVSEAFLVSAFAIFFAMVITVVEKFFISKLYQKVEELVFLLDARYKAGAGEQMLEQLVHSSQESVAHNKTLRDSLVTDLKGILTSLSESQIQAQERIIAGQIQAQQRIVAEQIEAHSQSSEQLSRQIGEHISAGLKTALEEPMKEISAALKSVSGERTGAVHTLLTEVVQGLSQSLKDLFGDQIAGINDMQQQTIAALQSAVARMEQMSTSLETAGTRATDSMATKLGEAITGMESRQELMARHMAQIVEEMKASVSSSHSETNGKLQEALAGVSSTIEALVSKLSQSVATSQDATNEKLQSALSGVTQTIESLVSTLSQSVATSQDATNEKLQSALMGVTQTVETLVSTLSQSVATSQDTTNEKLQNSLASVAQTVETLVSSLSQSVAATQTETNGKLQEAVSTVGHTVNSLVSGLSEQVASADAAHAARQNELAAQADAAASGVRDAVETLTGEIRVLVASTRSAVDTMRLSVDSMRTGVDSMRTVTNDTVSRMNAGAETMYVASSEFGKAGTAVSGVLQQATATTDKLAAAAGNVGTAAQTMQGVVNDYRLTRDHVSTMLTELTRVVDNARNNASLTGDVLSRIEASTRALNAAQVNAEEFMEGVSDVLGKSLTEFQHRLAESMTEVNRELVNRTSKVTSLLGQTIAELAQAVELVVPNQEA
jgi:hypothetical protein